MSDQSPKEPVSAVTPVLIGKMRTLLEHCDAVEEMLYAIDEEQVIWSLHNTTIRIRDFLSSAPAPLCGCDVSKGVLCDAHDPIMREAEKSLVQPPAPPQEAPAPSFDVWWTSTKFELGESPKSCAYRAWKAAGAAPARKLTAERPVSLEAAVQAGIDALIAKVEATGLVGAEIIYLSNRLNPAEIVKRLSDEKHEARHDS